MTNRLDIEISGGQDNHKCTTTTESDLSQPPDGTENISIIDLNFENAATIEMHRKEEQGNVVTYGIEDVPPLHLGLLLGLQVNYISLFLVYYVSVPDYV